jgi:transketolase
MLGQRGAVFGVALPELAKNMDNLWVLTADLASLSGLDRFKSSCPDKFLNVGIAEQNMIGIAAGLAKEGNCVFATTYATFVSMRSFEQIRNNMGYMKFNVKVIASSAGLAMGMSGNTHYAMEDIALMRSIPNMVVLSPADGAEAVKMIYAIAQFDGPVYMRLTGVQNCPVIYKEDYNFVIGEGIILKQGKDVALIATGTITHEALRTSQLLDERGISATVVNMHTIKPLDLQLLDRLFASHKLIVSIEEHSVIGGLGSAIAEHKATVEGSPRQMFIGIPDQFLKAGEYGYLLDNCGLTASCMARDIEVELQSK